MFFGAIHSELGGGGGGSGGGSEPTSTVRHRHRCHGRAHGNIRPVAAVGRRRRRRRRPLRRVRLVAFLRAEGNPLSAVQRDVGRRAMGGWRLLYTERSQAAVAAAARSIP